MAEMPDVVTLTTITSDWGNDIRDRTVQRYSSVANRTSEHGSPVEGDLSYLSDSNTVWVYNGSAWVQLVPGPVATASIDDEAVTAAKAAGDLASGLEVVSSAESTGPIALTTSLIDEASTTLAIPAGWGSWRCEAYATFGYELVSGTLATMAVAVAIDGTIQQASTSLDVKSVTGRVSGAVAGRRTGMTTTGSRTIALRGQYAGDPVRLVNVYLYARAVRTS